MGKPSDLIQGTLDLLILKTISLEPMHGWGIAQRIQQISAEVLQVQQGSLYPAIHRLEQQAWIRRIGARPRTTGVRNSIRLHQPGAVNWKRSLPTGSGSPARWDSSLRWCNDYEDD